MDPPPPYYATITTHETTNLDLATTIRQLSNETIKVDDEFESVYVGLRREEMFDQSAQAPSNEWKEVRELYIDLMCSTRNTATEFKAHTTDLVDVIIPVVSETDEDKQAKIAALTDFINEPAPPLLTTERAAEKIVRLKQQLGSFCEGYTTGLDQKIVAARHEIEKLEKNAQIQKLKQEEANESSYGLFGRLFHSKPAPVELVDYDTKIWWMQKKIQNWEKLRNGVEGGVRDICTGLDTIPERVGSAFWALWSYEKADTEHLRRVIESSPDGIVQDISIASETYKRIQAALQYYATNITKSGP